MSGHRLSRQRAREHSPELPNARTSPLHIGDRHRFDCPERTTETYQGGRANLLIRRYYLACNGLAEWWRSQGESNPCFRRERETKQSLLVHSGLDKQLIYCVLIPKCSCLSNDVCPCMLDKCWTRSELGDFRRGQKTNQQDRHAR